MLIDSLCAYILVYYFKSVSVRIIEVTVSPSPGKLSSVIIIKQSCMCVLLLWLQNGCKRIHPNTRVTIEKLCVYFYFVWKRAYQPPVRLLTKNRLTLPSPPSRKILYETLHRCMWSVIPVHVQSCRTWDWYCCYTLQYIDYIIVRGTTTSCSSGQLDMDTQNKRGRMGLAGQTIREGEWG